MSEIGKYPVVDVEGHEGLLTIACGPVIIEDEKVLLIRDSKDPFWKFPGGTLHEDQSYQETTRREAHEEIGVDIEIDPSIPPFIILFSKTEPNGLVKHYQLVHYLATIAHGQLTPGEGIIEIRQFPVDQLPADAGPNVKLAVEYFTKRSSR